MKLKITEGLSKTQIKELIDYSTSDSLIISSTSDTTRFGNITAVENWLDKGRSVYTLTDEDDKLHGIIWFGEKDFPIKLESNNFNYGITFAIRIYGNIRGKGFSKNFFKDSLIKYKKTEDYKKIKSKGIWLSADIDNKPALGLYRKVGFKMINESTNGKALMILE